MKANPLSVARWQKQCYLLPTLSRLTRRYSATYLCYFVPCWTFSVTGQEECYSLCSEDIFVCGIWGHLCHTKTFLVFMHQALPMARMLRVDKIVDVGSSELQTSSYWHFRSDTDWVRVTSISPSVATIKKTWFLSFVPFATVSCELDKIYDRVLWTEKI